MITESGSSSRARRISAKASSFRFIAPEVLCKPLVRRCVIRVELDGAAISAPRLEIVIVPISRCTESMSASCRSYFSPQSCLLSLTSINSVLTIIVLPRCMIRPVRTARTPNSLPTAIGSFSLPL